MLRLTGHGLPDRCRGCRAIPLAETAWQIGWVCLLLGISHRGRADDECQPRATLTCASDSDSCAATVRLPNAWAGRTPCLPNSAVAARGESAEPKSVPKEPLPVRPPILSGHAPRPPAEGLRDDQPNQVRVHLSRCRTTVSADSGRVTLAGGLSRGRSREGASRRPALSASLQELFCTWVI
jgi:hypothetical protein